MHHMRDCNVDRCSMSTRSAKHRHHQHWREKRGEKEGRHVEVSDREPAKLPPTAKKVAPDITRSLMHNASLMMATMTERMGQPQPRRITPHTSLLPFLSLLFIQTPTTFAFSPCLFTQIHSKHTTPSFLLFARSPVKNALFTQVISDVDDTLKSSGGVNVAGVALGGIDTQYARNEYYPGVAQFMLELSRYQGENVPPCTTPPKVAILTARAEEFKVALELKESSSLAKSFKETGEESGIAKLGIGTSLVWKCRRMGHSNKKGIAQI